MKTIALLSIATLQAVALANSQPLHERSLSPSFSILVNNTLVCEHVFDWIDSSPLMYLVAEKIGAYN